MLVYQWPLRQAEWPSVGRRRIGGRHNRQQAEPVQLWEATGCGGGSRPCGAVQILQF